MFNKEWEGTNFKPYIKDSKEGEIPINQYKFMFVKVMFTPRTVEFLKWDPKLYLPKIDKPVLMLYGAKDVNISLKPGVDSVKRIIKDYKLANFTLKYYKGLDHSLLPYHDKSGKRPTGESTPDYVFSDMINWLDEIKIN